MEGTFDPAGLTFKNGDKPTGYFYQDYDDFNILRTWYRAVDSQGNEYDTYETPSPLLGIQTPG